MRRKWLITLRIARMKSSRKSTPRITASLAPVKRICEAIIRDEKPILPISSYLEGEYGISDVVLSTPAIVGKNGLEYKVQVPINEEEQEKLEASAIALKEIIAQLDL